MRIAVFGSGGAMPLAAVRALHPVAEIAALVRPDRPMSLTDRMRGAARRLVRGLDELDDLSTLAAELGIPERRMRGPADASLAPFLRGLRLDLTCIATFSWRLPPDVLAAAARGTVNVHVSLLPRHRGPNPLLWIYHANDATTGVTVHVCDERLDTGPIVRQAPWPLARGCPVSTMFREMVTRGAGLLVETVAAIGRGDVQPTPQDDALATPAPRVSHGTPMVDYGWPVERVWHFLAGLVGFFQEPLSCAGTPVLYDRVPGFEVTGPRADAGTVEAVSASAWRLWCRDGFVRLERSAAP